MTITWFYLIKPGLVVNPYKLFDIQITESGELKYFIANIILLCCSVQSPRLLSLVLFDWSSQCGCHTILQITTIISSVNDCAALKRIDMVYHYLHHYLHQSDCQSWARLVELLNHGCHRYCLCWVRAEEQWMENIVVNCYESPWEFYQTNAKVEIKIHHVCFTQASAQTSSFASICMIFSLFVLKTKLEQKVEMFWIFPVNLQMDEMEADRFSILFKCDTFVLGGISFPTNIFVASKTQVFIGFNDWWMMM